MKILFIHNYYKQPGGEDVAFSSTVSLMQVHGHETHSYILNNLNIDDSRKINISLSTLWSRTSFYEIISILKKERPDIVHAFNTFPLISPSLYYACRSQEIPVIQSLDNPRLVCPAASFYRNNQLCTICLDHRSPWLGVFHGCYHHSKIHTSIVATMLTIHQWMGTWTNKVNLYLVATQFYRDLFIRGGLPQEKIIIKPHFAIQELVPMEGSKKGGYVLFVNRLDPEKGVKTLLEAWDQLSLPLIIRGSGQLESMVQEWIKKNPNKPVKLVERLSRTEIYGLMNHARFLVWPSEGYYETFGLTAVECFSLGIPVVASRIGVMAEIIQDGVTGLLFNPGDPEDLAKKVRWLWERPEECQRMGENARREYEQKYTPERNYQLLMDIYQKTVGQCP